MNTVEKRDYIHNYLIRLNDDDIDEMFKKVKSLVENDLVITSEQEEEIEKRVMRHKNGESKSYTWAEVKKRAKTKAGNAMQYLKRKQILMSWRLTTGTNLVRKDWEIRFLTNWMNTLMLLKMILKFIKSGRKTLDTVH
ncbi:MAG: addiction module protein [Bacteroidales bacterium]|nr:addiction module protein [Bacteroidales bacterium]